jgi:hypothetical protein
VGSSEDQQELPAMKLLMKNLLAMLPGFLLLVSFTIILYAGIKLLVYVIGAWIG